MTARVVTFSNLFPSAAIPTHGLFVYERMRRVAAALAAAGDDWDWRVVSPVPRVAWIVRSGQYRRWASVPASERWHGVEVHHPRYRHWPGLSMRRQASAMARGAMATVQRLCSDGPVVIDAHYLWPDGVAAAEVARRLSLPYVLTARGSDLNVVAQDRTVARRIAEVAAGAHACFAVSTPLCDRFAAVAGLPRERVRLVRNGVDLERFVPPAGAEEQASERVALGLPAGGRLLLGVGRLVAGKGFDTAAAALASLPGDVRLVLVGDGPERQTIAGKGGDRVHFLGAQPPDVVARAYRACDLFVLPSEREGWPNVVTEALASGLRVVATRVGGIPEILADPGPEDRSRGALVPPGEPAAFAAGRGRGAGRAGGPRGGARVRRALRLGGARGAAGRDVPRGDGCRCGGRCAVSLRILYHHRIRADDGQAVHVRELIGALRRRGHQVLECALVPKAGAEPAGLEPRVSAAGTCAAAVDGKGASAAARPDSGSACACPARRSKSWRYSTTARVAPCCAPPRASSAPISSTSGTRCIAGSDSTLPGSWGCRCCSK